MLSSPMRIATIACISFLAGSVLTAGALRQQALLADEATSRAVAEVKRAIVAGHKAKDASALAALYADDYTAIDRQGTLRTKADLLKALPTDADIGEGRYDLSSVRRWGTIAVAAGHGHLVYRNPDGTTRVSDYESFNVFEQRGGRWLYVAAFLP
jgi:ketosteroid isomerase-like protein